MAIYLLLEKDGITYKTTSWFYCRVARKLMGYKLDKTVINSSWMPLACIPLLPFRFSKEEREKYKIVLRLTKNEKKVY